MKNKTLIEVGSSDAELEKKKGEEAEEEEAREGGDAEDDDFDAGAAAAPTREDVAAANQPEAKKPGEVSHSCARRSRRVSGAAHLSPRACPVPPPQVRAGRHRGGAPGCLREGYRPHRRHQSTAGLP